MKSEFESVRQKLESLKFQDEEKMVTSEEGSKILVESLNGQIESLIKEVAAVKESHGTTEVRDVYGAIVLSYCLCRSP